jgi:hypothetical protein
MNFSVITKAMTGMFLIVLTVNTNVMEFHNVLMVVMKQTVPPKPKVGYYLPFVPLKLKVDYYHVIYT